MKKFICIIFMAISGLLFANISMAAETNIRIGIIEMQKLIQQSPEVKKIEAGLRNRFKPRQDKLIAAQNKLKSDQEKLERDAMVMSDHDKEKLQTQIITEKRDFDRNQADLVQDAKMAQQQAMQQFFKKVINAVANVAKGKKFNLVLPRSSVIYADPTLNITNDVLNTLNQHNQHDG